MSQFSSNVGLCWLRRALLAGIFAAAVTASPEFDVCEEESRHIVLVKTHKTGSSTLANVLYRFGELRKLKFMLPMDDLRLGWPDAFPGKYATKMRRGTSNETFGVVAHHAVLNYRVMLQYVPQAKFVSIVRSPVSQFTSAWYFFRVGVERQSRGPGKRPEKDTLTLGSLAKLFPPPTHEEKSFGDAPHLPVSPSALSLVAATTQSRMLNSQSFTLGWRQFVAASSSSSSSVLETNATRAPERESKARDSMLADANKTMVQQWLSQLHEQMDVVLVVERLDDSLLVMAHKLCWGWGDIDVNEKDASSSSSSFPRVKPLPHVAYLPVNSARKSYTHTNETAALATRLKEILVVDEQMYAWANARLSSQLAALDSSTLAAQRRELSNATASLAQECSAIATGSAAVAASLTAKGVSETANSTGENQTTVSRESTDLQERPQQRMLLERRSSTSSRYNAERLAEAKERLDASKQGMEAMRAVRAKQAFSRAQRQISQRQSSSSSSSSVSGGSRRNSELRTPANPQLMALAESMAEAKERRARNAQQASSDDDCGDEHPGSSSSSRDNCGDRTSRSSVSTVGATPEEPASVQASRAARGQVSARCWRHAAEQRSWAQHLKSLAGFACSKKLYKEPCRYSELPEEIKLVADACHDR